ncbi:hypothetical protein [Actinomadura decatromicini]|uniref:Uncharacterized protein n=1 Tax=Actinomadura decatromicini TaxID=2604572 RepID=A0A5D3FGS1_9ACTN|nr:hypothetical protein [Actinomadura decatromicini]TYK47184.1 hypothetical protein FXF68_25635 [Actinomadura decatromicini]
MNTIANAPAPGAVERFAAERDRYAADANRLAADLANGPTAEDLNRAEADLLRQLEDVRRSRTARAEREAEHRAAGEAAEFFAGLVERTRVRIEHRPPGPLVDRPRPYPDPLDGPTEQPPAPAATGGYPTAPAVNLPRGVEPLRTSGEFPIVAPTPQDATPVVPPGVEVATAGPGVTQPHADAQPEQRGPHRHRKGGRK